MPINETLKKLRTDRKLTQIEFAEIMNCNRQKIADWERGKSTPSADDLILLSQKFNVSSDYLLGLAQEPTTNKDINFICEYTGLSYETIMNLNKGKNAVFYTTLLNFLINNNILLKLLNNYLLSSIYTEYAKSDYIYLPLKDRTIYIRNPDIAQKVAYSSLLEVLPLQKEKMTDKIKVDNELKEQLLFALAKTVVDREKCKEEEMSIYGVYNYQTTQEELEEYYNSKQFEEDQLQLIYDELEELEEIQKATEEKEKRDNFILWFMDKLSKEKDGEQNADNSETQ